jgi:hypothetical protein
MNGRFTAHIVTFFLLLSTSNVSMSIVIGPSRSLTQWSSVWFLVPFNCYNWTACIFIYIAATGKWTEQKIRLSCWPLATSYQLFLVICDAVNHEKKSKMEKQWKWLALVKLADTLIPEPKVSTELPLNTAMVLLQLQSSPMLTTYFFQKLYPNVIFSSPRCEKEKFSRIYPTKVHRLMFSSSPMLSTFPTHRDVTTVNNTECPRSAEGQKILIM